MHLETRSTFADIVISVSRFSFTPFQDEGEGAGALRGIHDVDRAQVLPEVGRGQQKE